MFLLFYFVYLLLFKLTRTVSALSGETATIILGENDFLEELIHNISSEVIKGS